MSNLVSDKIYSKEKSSHWMAILFGFAFTLSIIPFYDELMTGIAQNDFEILFVLLFPLAGLYSMSLGWKKRKEFLALGLMPLSLSPPKGQIGGQVGGSIELNQPWKKRNLTLYLTCIHTYTTHSGDDSSRTHRDIVWQEQQRPHDVPNGAGSIINFCFDVPNDLPALGTYKSKGDINWEVRLEGEANQTPIERHWAIPVEAGNKQSNIEIPSAHKAEELKDNLNEAKQHLEQQVGITLTNHEFHSISEINRKPSKRLLLVVFGLIFLGVGLFLLNEAIQGDFILSIMAPVFSLIGFSISAMGLFLMYRKLESKIIDKTLYVRRSFLGYVLYRHHGALSDANQISLKRTMSSQQGSKRTEYYSVLANVHCDDGKIRDLKIAEGIEGKLVAEELQRIIFKQMMN